MATDLRTDEELRTCIRDGDPPERVLAAFELGRRLGEVVAGELSLDGEPDSGVRRHWLTILASFGERAAVRSIAEHRASSPEGEHAIHLAMQLGLTDPSWLAARFVDASEHTRAALLEREDLDWAATERALVELLDSDFAEHRRGAMRRLLGLQLAPGEALRRYAIREPSEAGEVFAAWAVGPDHAELARLLPVPVGRHCVGLEALRSAGRRYPLSHLRHAMLAMPRAFVLVSEPVDRSELWGLTDELLGHDQQPSLEWVEAVQRTLSGPWTDAERQTLARWAADARAWWAENGDWAEQEWAEPVQAQVLEALGYSRGGY